MPARVLPLFLVHVAGGDSVAGLRLQEHSILWGGGGNWQKWVDEWDDEMRRAQGAASGLAAVLAASRPVRLTGAAGVSLSAQSAGSVGEALNRLLVEHHSNTDPATASTVSATAFASSSISSSPAVVGDDDHQPGFHEPETSLRDLPDNDPRRVAAQQNWDPVLEYAHAAIGAARLAATDEDNDPGMKAGALRRAMLADFNAQSSLFPSAKKKWSVLEWGDGVEESSMTEEQLQQLIAWRDGTSKVTVVLPSLGDAGVASTRTEYGAEAGSGSVVLAALDAAHAQFGDSTWQGDRPRGQTAGGSTGDVRPETAPAAASAPYGSSMSRARSRSSAKPRHMHNWDLAATYLRGLEPSSPPHIMLGPHEAAFSTSMPAPESSGVAHRASSAMHGLGERACLARGSTLSEATGSDGAPSLAGTRSEYVVVNQSHSSSTVHQRSCITAAGERSSPRLVQAPRRSHSLSKLRSSSSASPLMSVPESGLPSHSAVQGASAYGAAPADGVYSANQSVSSMGSLDGASDFAYPTHLSGGLGDVSLDSNLAPAPSFFMPRFDADAAGLPSLATLDSLDTAHMPSALAVGDSDAMRSYFLGEPRSSPSAAHASAAAYNEMPVPVMHGHTSSEERLSQRPHTSAATARSRGDGKKSAAGPALNPQSTGALDKPAVFPWIEGSRPASRGDPWARDSYNGVKTTVPAGVGSAATRAFHSPAPWSQTLDGGSTEVRVDDGVDRLSRTLRNARNGAQVVPVTTSSGSPVLTSRGTSRTAPPAVGLRPMSRQRTSRKH
jgi:hypothetical protein